jgi:hypothetical protein
MAPHLPRILPRDDDAAAHPDAVPLQGLDAAQGLGEVVVAGADKGLVGGGVGAVEGNLHEERPEGREPRGRGRR